jgi:hypothetical protein
VESVRDSKGLRSAGTEFDSNRPWPMPALDHFCPTFGDQKPGTMPREMEHISDSARREIDTIDHIRQFASQTHRHHGSC